MLYKLHPAMVFLSILILSGQVSNTFANGDEHDHDSDGSMSVKPKVLEGINAAYAENILPIVEKKCFDCHSEFTNYPWYHKIPGIKQMINYDIREGREHLEMGKGTPFLGDASVSHDLEEMIEVVEEDEMPPLMYRLMHWDSKLSNDEKELILSWARSSLEKLGQR